MINLPTPDERNTGRTPAGPAIPLRGFHILFLLLLFSLKARRHAALLFLHPPLCARINWRKEGRTMPNSQNLSTITLSVGIILLICIVILPLLSGTRNSF